MYTKRTISDCIYEELKQQISCLEIEPGTKLSEAQLAERFGVSRAPVKNALNKLAYDGLVEIKPQSGTIVAPISYKLADNIRDIRYLLEPYAVKQAVLHVPEEQLEELRLKLLRLSGMNEDTNEKRKYITEVDAYMHSIILENCGNPALCDIVEAFMPKVKRISFMNMERHNKTTILEAEVRKISNALFERDAEAASIAMQEHISNIKHELD